MSQLVNHVDHICWVSRLENLEENARKLSEMTGVRLDGPRIHEHLGLRAYLSWEGGLEIVAPLEGADKPVARQVNAFLAERGEGLWSIVFGVPDIDAAVSRARQAGYDAHAPADFNGADDHWTGKTKKTWEALCGDFLGTAILFGEIVYKDGVLTTK